MKILWVEDFGGGLSPSQVVIEMFKDIIPLERFDLEYDPRVDVAKELPRLFEKHTFHQIYVCKSYTEWESLYQEQEKDFDLVLLDINLEAYRTSPKEMPKGITNTKFDDYAGFYIYHRLIKDGFPDENIAFFTGYSNSLLFFSQYCSEILFERPRNTFEKTLEGFADLREWLYDKLNYDFYLILRRGIIEGCRFLRNKIANLPKDQLEDVLLFYKTIRSKKGDLDHQAHRNDLVDYLTMLEGFFSSFRKPANHNYVYQLFIKELASKWERSSGQFLPWRNPPLAETRLEDKFLTNCQRQMRILRNWTAHNLFSPQVTEQEVAYFFMLAMRAYIHIGFNEVLEYEKILGDLFSALKDKESEKKFVTNIEAYLLDSYHRLHQEFKDELDASSRDNSFTALLDEFGRQPEEKRIQGEFSEILQRKIQQLSVRLFFQSFWHGLFPSWIDANQRAVCFEIEPIPSGTFAHFVGKLIFKKSFED